MAQVEAAGGGLKAPAPRRTGRFLSEVAPPVAAFLLVAGVWEAAVRLRNIPPYLLPAPSAVALRLWADGPALIAEGVYTLLEALLGFGLGSAAAVVVGAAMARWRLLERSLYPLAVLVKVTPVVTVAPLFIIWFGFGLLPKVLIAALITFFPVLVNAVTGLKAVEPAALEFFESVGASKWEIFLKLRFPASLPYLFAAFRVSVVLGLIGAVVAEWLGAERGLGRAVLLANQNLDMAGLFAGVFLLALCGVGLTGLIRLWERQLLFWHETYLTTEELTERGKP
jgi:NitT/TauT family transport system permease protein